MRSRGCKSARGGRREAVGEVREWSWSERRVGGDGGAGRWRRVVAVQCVGCGQRQPGLRLGFRASEREGQLGHGLPSGSGAPPAPQICQTQCGRLATAVGAGCGLFCSYGTSTTTTSVQLGNPRPGKGAIWRTRNGEAARACAHKSSHLGVPTQDLRIGYSRTARSTFARRGAVDVPLSLGLSPSPSLEKHTPTSAPAGPLCITVVDGATAH